MGGRRFTIDQLKNFLLRVDVLLAQHRMSRTELGEKLGLPYNSISHWWKKSRKSYPPADDVLKVAIFFWDIR